MAILEVLIQIKEKKEMVKNDKQQVLIYNWELLDKAVKKKVLDEMMKDITLGV